MYGEFLALTDDVEVLKTALGGALEVGSVEEIDAVKGYRLRLGDDAEGGAYLSPWYPHPETEKTSVPLKKGQVVGRLNPSGDDRQGFLIRGGYSDANASPNDDMAANVFEDAGVRIKIASGELTITIGGVTWVFSGSGETQTGGAKMHDEKNVGSTHRHGGVARGGAFTDPPA